MTYRRPLIVGNWKMNGDSAMAESLLRGIGDGIGAEHKAEIVACPPFVFLALARRIANEGRYALSIGAQDVSNRESGAFTGEISAAMLRELGCAYAIAGHSERRQHHGESDDAVARKAVAAHAAGIVPIVCVGETLEQREAQRARDVVVRQLEAVLDRATDENLRHMALAYEPVWAIGTGNVAAAEQVQEVHGWLRERLREADPQAAENCRILYGGSVTGDNVENLLALPDVDGCLVGGASLRADAFLRICLAAGN